MTARARSIPAWRSARSSDGCGLDEADADPGRRLAVGRVGVDDDVARARAAQVARDLTTHATVAADDEVVAGRVDHLLHPTRGQQVGDCPATSSSVTDTKA